MNMRWMAALALALCVALVPTALARTDAGEIDAGLYGTAVSMPDMIGGCTGQRLEYRLDNASMSATVFEACDQAAMGDVTGALIEFWGGFDAEPAALDAFFGDFYDMEAAAAMDVTAKMAEPSPAHPMGTDPAGRDMLQQIILHDAQVRAGTSDAELLVWQQQNGAVLTLTWTMDDGCRAALIALDRSGADGGSVRENRMALFEFGAQ